MDPAVLNAPIGDFDPQLSETAAQYLAHLQLADRANQESMIDDFSRETLRLLGYPLRAERVISTRFIIPLTICGDKNRSAQTDVCVIHRPTMILLLLDKDKTIFNHSDPEPQVVAEAIAAFQYNNRLRAVLALDPLDSMTIPCITMSGTRPTFYLVPVTAALSQAVISGQYPATATTVLKCATVLGHQRRASDGMINPEYRKLALRRFVAFKAVAQAHWERILAGVE